MEEATRVIEEQNREQELRNPSMISARGITAGYGRRQVLCGVDMTAERGECIGIAGANGCGKSTLLAVMAGTLRPKAGELSYYGHNAIGRRDVFRRMTGYVPQEDGLLPELTVYDNLRLWYPDKKALASDLEDGFLALMGIPDFVKMPAGKLSGGMKKRVSLGCALAGLPPVLLLDEPGAALDLPCKEDIRRYLRLYLDKKGTVVMATHEEPELDLCDRLYVMKDGRLREVDVSLRGEKLMALF